jgi:autotransporter-associated beta strand protein
LQLSGSNTYTGATTLSNGILLASSAGALGSSGTHTSGITVASGAQLDIGGVTLNTTAPLSIAGAGILGLSGAINSTTGTSVFGGAVTMTADSTIIAASGATLNLSNTINSQVGNTYALTIKGPGAVGLNNTVGATTALSSLTSNSNVST